VKSGPPPRENARDFGNRGAILVNRGAAIIETQKIERIDKFPAD
jgi:hypothetical protein